MSLYLKKYLKIKLIIFTSFFCQFVCSQDYNVARQLIEDLYTQAQQDITSGKSFTQSQAHLISKIFVNGKSVYMKDQILYKYANNKNFIAPNKEIIQQIFEKEREVRDSGKKYYVFYTAVPYMHLMQDLSKRLYEYNFGKKGELQNDSFQFLRYFFQDPFFSQYKDVSDFFISEIKKNKIIDDNLLKNKIILLSENLSLFGGLGVTGESTFVYFNKPQRWVSPNPMFIEDSLNSFGFLNIEDYSKKFLNILQSDLYADQAEVAEKEISRGSDLFQFFIPADLVDKIGYKSWRQGFPFDINLLKKIFPNKLQDISTLDDSKKILAKDISDVIEKIQAESSVEINSDLINFIENSSNFLSNYIDNQYITRKDPLMNFVQARILITNDTILNPESGIKIFRYTTIEEHNLTKYESDFNQVFDEMTEKEPAQESQLDIRIINQLVRSNDVLSKNDPTKQFSQSQLLINYHDIVNKIKQTANAAYKNRTIINQIFDREQKLSDDYYVFYTAMPYMRLFQDVTYILHKNLKESSESLENKEFIFLRYDLDDSIYKKYENVSDFLKYEINKYCIVDDRISNSIKTLLLSTNVSLFGNIDLVGESTWGFFLSLQTWAALNKIYLETIFEEFGIPVNYADYLISHAELLKDAQGNIPPDLIQIFIPKNMADKVSYISLSRGIPFDLDFIKSICNFAGFVPDLLVKIFGAQFQGLPQQGSFKELVSMVEKSCSAKTFSKDIDNALISRVNAGEFKPSNLLDFSKINKDYYPYYQSRIMFTNGEMLNPNSGIKIFRYSQLTATQEQEYNLALENSLNKILNEYKDKNKSISKVEEIINKCLAAG